MIRKCVICGTEFRTPPSKTNLFVVIPLSLCVC
nr:MAG TPA: C2H2 type zinc-finger protein [Caudoviricetes sp.]